MSKEQVAGIVRHVLGAVGAYVVAQGLVSEDVATQASGAIATLIAVVWSVVSKKTQTPEKQP